jgi:hypothetical protein
MRLSRNRASFATVAFAAAVVLGGCSREEEGPAERAGRKIDAAAQGVAEGAAKARAAVTQAAQRTADAAAEAAAAAKEAAKEAGHDAAAAVADGVGAVEKKLE